MLNLTSIAAMSDRELREFLGSFVRQTRIEIIVIAVIIIAMVVYYSKVRQDNEKKFSELSKENKELKKEIEEIKKQLK